jgi:APA family basic amino acid/polyamine antiporter
LKRALSWYDLLFYGVGSTIGGGIYSLIATGALVAGPGMLISFLICAMCCALTGFVYAEFVARVPESGSAYSFAYSIFGEVGKPCFCLVCFSFSNACCL